MALSRRTVTVEFAKSELPITDKDIRYRMQRLLELGRGDKILSLTISTRSYLHREKRFLFEGIAQIEPADSTEINEPAIRPVPCGQPGGPKTGWWQRTIVSE